MNPYHFNNPSVRAIAFDLAKALADFDANATAALVSAEQRIAALEATGGRHEVDHHQTEDSKGLASLNAAPVHPTFMVRLEALRQVPLAKVPMQDVDVNAPHYSRGLSGRCA